MTNEILVNILMQLSSNKNNTGPIQTPDIDQQNFAPDRHDILVIALMYSSLALCLFAAGGALLAKLWLIEYHRAVKVVDESLSAHDRAINRQKIYGGLKKWGFGAIMASLPIILLISLVIFYLALQ